MEEGIRVPIDIRTHELNQAHEFIPRIIERLSQVDVETAQEQADELDRIYADYIEDVEAPYFLSMPADDWRTLVGALARLRDEEGLRVWWFRKKLVDRLQERLEEMED